MSRDEIKIKVAELFELRDSDMVTIVKVCKKCGKKGLHFKIKKLIVCENCVATGRRLLDDNIRSTRR